MARVSALDADELEKGARRSTGRAQIWLGAQREALGAIFYRLSSKKLACGFHGFFIGVQERGTI